MKAKTNRNEYIFLALAIMLAFTLLISNQNLGSIISDTLPQGSQGFTLFICDECNINSEQTQNKATTLFVSQKYEIFFWTLKIPRNLLQLGFLFFENKIIPLENILTGAAISINPLELTPTINCANQTVCTNSSITTCENITSPDCSEQCVSICSDQWVNGVRREVCTADCASECSDVVEEVCTSEILESCLVEEVCETTENLAGTGLGTMDLGIMAAPTHDPPILNATDNPLNQSWANLTLYPQNVADGDGDPIKNTTTWRINGTSITSLAMTFDGGLLAESATKTKDYSDYGNNGTVSSAVYNETGGFDGKGAYQFDGTANNYINLSSDLSLDVLKYTVMFWAKGNSDVTDADISQSAVSGSFDGLGFNYIFFWGHTVPGSKQSFFAYSTKATLTTPLLADTWYHVAATFNGSLLSLYLDGVLEHNVTGPALTSTPSASSYIGSGDAFIASVSFNGSIDDVYIINRSLSNETIKAWYENQTGLISNLDTAVGEVWQGCTTPNDNNSDGPVKCSNNLTILSPNSNPNVTQVILNATSLNNLTSDNLTASWTVSDGDGDSVQNITNWYVNGTSITVLNLPFENHTTNVSNITNDYSGYGNTGLVINATWNATGGYDGSGAYEFDGINDEINFSADSSLNITKSLTMTAWIKVNKWNTDGIGFIVKTLSDPSYGDYHLIGSSTANRIIFGINNITQFVQWDSFSIGSWQHVAGTYDGETLRLYLNGSEVNTTTYSGTITTDYNGIRIGNYWNTNFNLHLNGSMDEVRILNRTLSPEQILALYNNRTDLIVSNETVVGDNWSICVTPNDGLSDGTIQCSNNLTILASPDTIPPNVTALIPVNNSVFNVSNVIEISANVSDDVGVDTVLANLTYPNGTINQLTLTNSSGYANKFNTSFTVPLSTGLYNVSFWANDTSNNINNSETTNFTVELACGISITSSITLTKNVTYSGSDNTCFSITSNNTVFDCNGYWMIGPDNASDASNYAILGGAAFPTHNLTIKNCNFKGFSRDTIQLNGAGSNQTIVNNNFTQAQFNASGAGSYIYTGARGDCNISSNRLENFYVGSAGDNGIRAIVLGAACNNSHIMNNYINNLTYDGVEVSAGILIANAQNVTVSSNEIHNLICPDCDPIVGFLDQGTNNIFSNNIINNTVNGIIMYGSGLTVTNNTIYNASYGIYYGLEGSGTASNVISSNNTFINTTTCDYSELSSNINISGNNYSNCTTDVYVVDSTGLQYLGMLTTNNLYIDAVSNTTFANLSVGNTTTYASYLNLVINTTETNLSRGFSYGSDWLFINSTNNSALNTFANLTFTGVTYGSNAAYTILKDGTTCSDCTKLGFNPVKFQVTGFSNYSIEDYTAPAEEPGGGDGDGDQGGEPPPPPAPPDNTGEEAAEVASLEQVITALDEGVLTIDVGIVDSEDNVDVVVDDETDVFSEEIYQDLEITFINKGELAVELTPEVEEVIDLVLDNEEQVIEKVEEDIIKNEIISEDDVQREPPIIIETIDSVIVNNQNTPVTIETTVSTSTELLENDQQVEDALFQKFSTNPQLSTEQIKQKVEERLATLRTIEEKDVQFLSKGKTIGFNAGGLSYSGEQTTGKLLRAQALDSKEIVLQPGENFEDKLNVRSSLTVKPREREITVVYSSTDGKTFSEKTTTIIEEPKLGGIVNFDTNENLLDLYLVIPVIENSFSENDYSFEVSIIDENEKVKFTELYGPFTIDDQKGAIFAQNFKYDHKEYQNNHTVGIKIFQSRKLVSENEYELDFNTEKITPLVAYRKKLSKTEITDLTKERVKTIKLIETKNVQYLTNKKILPPGGLPLFGKVISGARKKSLAFTGGHTSGEFLKVTIVNPATKTVSPGETITEKYPIRTGLTTGEEINKSIKVNFFSQGQKVFDQDKVINENSRLEGVIGVDAQNRLLDFYVVIPKDIADENKDYTFELTLDKEDGRTKFAEYYGPFQTKKDTGLLIAQQFNYNAKSYKSKHLVTIKIYGDSHLISTNIYKINFRTGLVEPLALDSIKVKSTLWLYLVLFLLVVILSSIFVKITSDYDFARIEHFPEIIPEKKHVVTKISKPVLTPHLPLNQRIKRLHLGYKLDFDDKLNLLNQFILDLKKELPSSPVKKKSKPFKRRIKEQVLGQELKEISRKAHGYIKPKIQPEINYLKDELTEINQKLEDIKVPSKKNVVIALPTPEKVDLSQSEKKLQQQLEKVEQQLTKPIVITPPKRTYTPELIALEQELANLDNFVPKQELAKHKKPKQKIKKIITPPKKVKLVNQKLIKLEKKNALKLEQELAQLNQKLKDVKIPIKKNVVTALPTPEKVDLSQSEKKLQQQLEKVEQQLTKPIVITPPKRTYTPELIALEQELANLDNFVPKHLPAKIKHKKKKKRKKRIKLIKKKSSSYKPNSKEIKQFQDELSQIEEELANLN